MLNSTIIYVIFVYVETVAKYRFVCILQVKKKQDKKIRVLFFSSPVQPLLFSISQMLSVFK